jgi:uncharacterized protein YegP (UPF0339 family)
MPKLSPARSITARPEPLLRIVPAVEAPDASGAAHPSEIRRRTGPGSFELVHIDGGGCLLRLLDGNGTLVALSGTYPDIDAAVHGVEAVREYAASSHISDRTLTAERPDMLPSASPPD